MKMAERTPTTMRGIFDLRVRASKRAKLKMMTSIVRPLTPMTETSGAIPGMR